MTFRTIRDSSMVIGMTGGAVLLGMHAWLAREKIGNISVAFPAAGLEF